MIRTMKLHVSPLPPYWDYTMILRWWWWWYTYMMMILMMMMMMMDHLCHPVETVLWKAVPEPPESLYTAFAFMVCCILYIRVWYIQPYHHDHDHHHHHHHDHHDHHDHLLLWSWRLPNFPLPGWGTDGDLVFFMIWVRFVIFVLFVIFVEIVFLVLSFSSCL